MNQEQLDKISAYDWGNIYKRLTAVSVYWSKFFFGKGWNNLPKGYTHEDLAQEAIRRATSREWDTVDEEILLKFLFEAVKSITSNLRRSSKTQMTTTFTNMENSEDVIPDGNESVDEEELALFSMDYKTVLSLIYQRIGDDGLLSQTFDEIRKGHTPKEIATIMRIDVKEVYNLKKRLFRIVEELASQNSDNERK